MLNLIPFLMKLDPFAELRAEVVCGLDNAARAAVVGSVVVLAACVLCPLAVPGALARGVAELVTQRRTW